MRKLLSFFFALAVTVGVSVSAFGQMSLTGAGGTRPPPSAPAVTASQNPALNNGGSTITFSNSNNTVALSGGTFGSILTVNSSSSAKKMFVIHLDVTNNLQWACLGVSDGTNNSRRAYRQ
jgi:hypothetical protein